MSSYAGDLFPQGAYLVFPAGIFLIVTGLAGVIWAALHKETPIMSNDRKTQSKGDNGLEVGEESVVYGNVKGRVGNRSVVIGPTHGTNTILTTPGAYGHGAYAGPGSIAIGFGAGAGSRSKIEDGK